MSESPEDQKPAEATENEPSTVDNQPAAAPEETPAEPQSGKKPAKKQPDRDWTTLGDMRDSFYELIKQDERRF